MTRDPAAKEGHTPETDAAELDSSHFTDWGHGPSGYVPRSDMAKLESDRTHLRERVKELESAVMYMSQSAPKGIPLADAAAGDPLVKEALKKVASGSVAAQAPAGQDPIVWTDLDVQKLDAALARCFGGKKQ